MDPLTAKIITKAATTVVTDEESRKRVLVIILASVIGILLLIAMILQILTMPFGALSGAFLGDELNYVVEMRADTDYTQLTDRNSIDWHECYGVSFEGIVLTGGETEVVYYNQFDSRWADIMYGTSSTISEGGCGPTSLAIIVSTLTGVNHDPVEMAEWSVRNGHRCEGNGSYHSLIPEGSKAFRLKVEGCGPNDYEKIATALSEGKLVGALMSKGHFTNGGHYIVLRGITAEGKVLVADPGSRIRSNMEWDFDIILNEARRGAGAGGPFWIVSS